METSKVLIIFSLEILLTEDRILSRLSAYYYLLKLDTQNKYISLEAIMKINGLTMGKQTNNTTQILFLFLIFSVNFKYFIFTFNNTLDSDSVMSVTLDLVKILMKMIPFSIESIDYLSGYLLQLLLKIKLFVSMVESVHRCITFQKSRTSSDL